MRTPWAQERTGDLPDRRRFRHRACGNSVERRTGVELPGVLHDDFGILDIQFNQHLAQEPGLLFTTLHQRHLPLRPGHRSGIPGNPAPGTHIPQPGAFDPRHERQTVGNVPHFQARDVAATDQAIGRIPMPYERTESIQTHSGARVEVHAVRRARGLPGWWGFFSVGGGGSG